jgi:hypothetical protein
MDLEPKDVTLDLLTKMWAEDAQINKAAIEFELTRIDSLLSKYQGIYSYHYIESEKINIEAIIKKNKRTRWAKGKMSKEEMEEEGWEPNPEKMMRKEIAMAIEADPEVSTILLRKATLDEICNFSKNVIKTLHNRGWNLGKVVDHRKFEAGM